jgi:hypothetical protein
MALSPTRLLAEFEGSPDALEQLLLAGNNRYPLEHVAERIRQQQAEAAEHEPLLVLAPIAIAYEAEMAGDGDRRSTWRTDKQVELLALVRGTGATSAQLRALLELSPQARQAIADLVAHTMRAEPDPFRHEEGSAS